MSQKHILLVDDEDHIREVAQLSLETLAGWDVRTAASGVRRRPSLVPPMFPSTPSSAPVRPELHALDLTTDHVPVLLRIR